MEFKGTKGSWSYDTTTKTFTLQDGYVVPMPSMFSSTKPEVNVFGNDPMWIEAQSNAKLIASAPDLLEALQRCNKALATYNSSKAVDAYLIAQKAIEKALS